MRFLAWNCRGAGLTDSPTIPFICYLANNLVTDFVFLSETKCKISNLESKFARLGFVNCTGSDNILNKGGLFLCWSSKMSVVDDQKVESYVTFMYGSPYIAEREEIWSNISMILNVYSGSHHLLIGDLNQLESHKQKQGGSQKIPLGSKMFTLQRRLEIIRTKCMKWCLNYRKEAGLNWATIKDQLEKNSDVDSQKTNGEKKMFRENLEKDLQEKWAYWRQRAKSKWDDWGDQSTRFFFRSVKTRATKNGIKAIKNVEDIWVADQKEIKNEFHRHFEELLRENNPTEIRCEEKDPWGGPKISHLFFADDALFFKANEQSCKNLTECLNQFCRISGEQININKSFAMFSP
ncbi:LINE-1 retrotransposable element ORF2 protein, partial [Bienertia sinuspersici]